MPRLKSLKIDNLFSFCQKTSMEPRNVSYIFNISNKEMLLILKLQHINQGNVKMFDFLMTKLLFCFVTFLSSFLFTNTF